ncbi:MAG TPA: response regulator, partial [Acidobacteriota bacterium]|nr:response regulator [Acidobacteriota bacterium]
NPTLTESKVKTGPLGQPRVLVVEDNKVNQILAKITLENLNVRVDLAEDGFKALEALAKISYDLIFMDCQLPLMDGFETTAVIREQEMLSNRHIPVIALTANAMRGDRERCLAAGMDDYVSKPFQPQDFQSILERWLPKVSETPTPESEPPILPLEQSYQPDEKVLSSDSLEQLMTLADGDGSFLHDFLELAYTNFAEHITTLHKTVPLTKRKRLRETAHSLKGACATIGAATMVDLCHQLEEFAAETPVSTVQDLITQLEQAFTQVKTEMTAYLRNKRL